MRSLKTLLRIGIPTLLIVAFGSFFIYFSSQAASLTAVYVFFSRIQAGLDGSGANEVQLILAVAPAQSMSSGGTITIEFPDAGDTTWCRAAGTMTATGVSSSAADMSATNWAIDSALPGTLTASCSQGSGTGSVDIITITGVGALTANETYGVRIQTSTGRLGTNGTPGQHELTVTVSNGAVIDSKTFKIQLVANDQVVVSATVSDAPSVTCSISSNSVNLGTLYPGGAYAVGSHTITTNTSVAGYYWAAYGKGDSSTDAGLYKSTSATYLIPSGTLGSTVDLTVPGSEGFGMTVSDPDGGGGAVVPSNFSDGTPGTFGTLNRLYSGAKLILYQNGAQSSAEAATVTYGARAGASALAGSYQETVTFICGGYY